MPQMNSKYLKGNGIRDSKKIREERRMGWIFLLLSMPLMLGKNQSSGQT
jgi:hypothetical protein